MTLVPLDEHNAEIPIDRLGKEPQSQDLLYRRSNFGVPAVDPASWRLEVSGERSLSFSIDDLQGLGEHSETMVLECAGNGRSLMDPVPEGTAWRLGGVGVVEATGVPLSAVLAEAGVPENTADVVFTGADRGTVDGGDEIPYQFSLSPRLARDEGPLLAWALSGTPLTPEHGAPLRLVVPGHYGMQSVKWLTRIETLDQPFVGHFRQKYRFFSDEREPEGAPVGPIQVRSLITAPADREPVAESASGIAWSDGTPITKVEWRLDDGPWQPARLDPAASPFAPAGFSFAPDAPPGMHRLTVRASDAAGRIQPLRARWNGNGYANNVAHTITVRI